MGHLLLGFRLSLSRSWPWLDLDWLQLATSWADVWSRAEPGFRQAITIVYDKKKHVDKHINQINVCVTIQKRKLNTKRRKLNVIEKKENKIN